MAAAAPPGRTELLLDSFATRSFRDVADGDYIAARMACRAGLLHQQLWASQQAIEKYLKAILLYGRIPAKEVKHDIDAALRLAERLPFPIALRPSSREFIAHVATYGEHRYHEVSPFLFGPTLLNLDIAIWDLRRYCRPLRRPDAGASAEEIAAWRLELDRIAKSGAAPPHETRVRGGFLEQVIGNPRHPSRPALLWQNAMFGARRRGSVRVESGLRASNAPLWLNPELADEVAKYVYVPKPLLEAYRQQAARAKRSRGAGNRKQSERQR